MKCLPNTIHRTSGHHFDSAPVNAVVLRLLATGVLVLAALAGGVSLASAQTRDFANIQTAAEVIPLFQPTQVLTACGSNLINGLQTESTGVLTCNAGAAGSSAAVEVFASVTPSSCFLGQPYATCGLTQLKSKARIDISQGSTPTNSETLATSTARFKDYLHLGGTRPNQMTFDFEVTGGLNLRDVPASSGDRMAKVVFHMYAQSGVWGGFVPGGNSGFSSNSFGGFGQGISEANRSIYFFGTNDQSDPGSIFPFPQNSADFQLTAAGTGRYRLTLGPSFFQNPLNTHVLFEFAVTTEVRLPGAVIPYDLFAVSDFSNSVRLSALHAYDAAGTEITASSFLGFESTRLNSGAPTPAGSVTVVPLDSSGAPQPITVTFPNVTVAGVTNATQVQLAPPANFLVNGAVYDITTTAKYTALPTSPLTVCFSGSFAATDQIYHYVGNVFVPLQNTRFFPFPSTAPYSVICGNTLSLSPFAVLTPGTGNNPPSASAGTNQTVEATSPAGAPVSLSGSGSDPDSDPLTFSWSGPCGATTGANVTLTCSLGTSVMTLTVSDGRGGSATSNVQITVRDSTAPAIVCAAPDIAWHATDVTIVCSASDVVGLLNPADASFALTTIVPAGTETAAAMTGSRSVCDGSNNCVTAGPIGPIKVDKKAPVVVIGAPLDSATYSLNQLVAASFSCTDGGSGVGNCNAPVANGANVDTASAGGKTFTVTTTDAVGNNASATVNYSVVATSGLCLGEPNHAILLPIAQNGLSVFKQGSTVPARFRVCDPAGNSIGATGFVSGFRLIQIISGGVVQNVDAEVPSTTPFTAFRWDPQERVWIFNISTKGYLPGGAYNFRISLNDGTEIQFGFSLK